MALLDQAGSITPERTSDANHEKQRYDESSAGDSRAADYSGHDAKAPAEVVRELKSPGVARVEAIASVLTLYDRIAIYFGVFLIAYAYGLDGTLRYSYQPTAASSFGEHSLTSTVSIIRAVIGAGVQPTAGKIADVFGRVELILVSCFFYVVGTIVQSTAQDVTTLAAGSAIYQIGYTIVILLVEVVIADISSTRARLFFSYIPALPFLINTWVSGDIAEAVLGATTWRWGYGMWCIIYPVCALPLIISLTIVARRAKRRGLLQDYKSSFQILGAGQFFTKLFWLLDVVGMILLLAIFALILVPFTLAGGIRQEWGSAKVIAPLVIGVICVPIFIIWELRAPHPIVPFRLMKDRSVWAPVMIAITLNFAWSMQGNYLYSVLVVAFDFSIKGATRVTSLYSFTSVVVGTLLGMVVYKVRRLKYFMVFGTCLFMVAFGLLVHFRGATSDNTSKAGVIAAQVILGAAGGMFPYPAQASLQVYMKHEDVAVMTGVFLAMYNVGSALGNTVAGSIWTQLLPGFIEDRLDNQDLVAMAYGDPFSFIVEYPFGTPERTALVGAYREIQRLLAITGLVLCVPLIAWAIAMRNPRLNDEQTLAKAADQDNESERVQAEPQPQRA